MSQALYRRYRPDTFAEVIGQEHVTEPLMQALRADRVTHAYLFSGPRGCGKTTSARILARCLNCEQGPAPTPCGTCPSCVELGRGGSGSLDGVEIDAASHNGVDDARDLRERAAFAPARDRFKVFILDEAHMVTLQGFNALLKIVEEPPPHVKFIFATTEPDKVIGTIRSRTHHYPFRLVAPDTLTPYLEQLCEAEGVQVGSGVLPLVVRAGGGSVRDSLSVLDQLVAGADADGVDYERAVALLGYTHATLLDDVVGAISTRDGASAFRVVDRVITSGHEPRRFIEDLLERFRDLIVVAASGEAARAALRDLPADQLDRMRAQAATLGAAELSRSADLVNTALTEMTGATSPRLHLELLVARLLLPAVDDSGVVARLERVERAVTDGAVHVGGVRTRAVAEPVPARAAAQPVAVAAPAEPVAAEPPVAARAEAEPVEAEPVPARAAAQPVAVAAPAEPVPEVVEPAEPVAAEAAADAPPASSPPTTGLPSVPPGEAEMVRRRWPEVMETLKGLSRVSWALVSENATVAAVEDGVIKLAFTTPQLVGRGGGHVDHVRRAVLETLGLDARIEPVLAPSTRSDPSARAQPPAGPTGPTPAEAAASWDTPAPAPTAAAPTAAASARAATPPRAESRPRAARSSERAEADEPPGDPDPDPGRAEPDVARAAAPTPPPPVRRTPDRPRRTGARPAPATTPAAGSVEDGDDASPDDPELVSSGLVGAPLVAQVLGGMVIDEIPEESG